MASIRMNCHPCSDPVDRTAVESSLALLSNCSRYTFSADCVHSLSCYGHTYYLVDGRVSYVTPVRFGAYWGSPRVIFLLAVNGDASAKLAAKPRLFLSLAEAQGVGAYRIRSHEAFAMAITPPLTCVR